MSIEQSAASTLTSHKSSDADNEVGPVEFEHVLKEEVQTLRGEANLPTDSEALFKRILALPKPLVGLAFSGGGIRSATFNLGVLQGLADCTKSHEQESPKEGQPKPDDIPRGEGLLGKIDYLSTVSGGGYIGGWFTSWVLRDGDLKNVEKQLRPNRFDQTAEATRTDDEFDHRYEGRRYDAEPPPISHLREYSNYLAPRVGIFSADAWTLYAIYLRNLLAIQVILLPLILTVVFGVFGIAWCYVNFEGLILGLVSIVFGAIPLLVSTLAAAERLKELRVRTEACHLASGELPQGVVDTTRSTVRRPESNSNSRWGKFESRLNEFKKTYLSGRDEESVFAITFLFILAAAAIVAGLATLRYAHPESLIVYWAPILIAVIGRLYLNSTSIIVLPAVVRRWLATRKSDHQHGPALKQWRRASHEMRSTVRWILSGVASAATSSSLLILFEYFCLGTDQNPIFLCTFGAPLVLMMFATGEAIALAILSELESPKIREWFAALAGKVLMAASAWAVLFSLILYVPDLIDSIPRAKIWVALSWLATSIWTARVAHSATSDGRKGLSVTDVVVKAGPPIFLIGLFVFVAWATIHILMYVLPTPSIEVVAYSNRLWWFLDRNVTGYFDIPHWVPLLQWLPLPKGLLLPICAAASIAIAASLGRLININLFSLQELYQNRLIRCYLGASRHEEPIQEIQPEMPDPEGKASSDNVPFRVRETSPGGMTRAFDPLTGFGECDDFKLCELRSTAYTGPLPIICTALDLVRGDKLAWQERMAESFVMTPYFAGSKATKYRPIGSSEALADACYGGGIKLGQAIALSGAAVSPNMGYYSSAPVTALLTIFNLRLGAWLGNPKSDEKWTRPGPKMGWFHLLKEALGFTDAAASYVYISDGGHFDNLGIYELIRRRCRVIICCDAGADPTSSMHELGMIIRKIRIDFGIRIEINTDNLKPDQHGFSRSHVAVGKIAYSDRHGDSRTRDAVDPENHFNKEDGYLVYVKPSFTGDEPTDLIDYRTSRPDFPHESTLDQFFSESQFESYRTLGSHIIKSIFCESVNHDGKSFDGDDEPVEGDEDEMLTIVKDVYSRFEPILTTDYVAQYLAQNDGYRLIQTALRTDTKLNRLAQELAELGQKSPYEKTDIQNVEATDHVAERQILLEMLTVMENTYFALGLNQSRFASTTAGWLHAFDAWVCSTPFTKEWKSVKLDFSPEFQRFMNSRKTTILKTATKH